MKTATIWSMALVMGLCANVINAAANGDGGGDGFNAPEGIKMIGDPQRGSITVHCKNGVCELKSVQTPVATIKSKCREVNNGWIASGGFAWFAPGGTFTGLVRSTPSLPLVTGRPGKYAEGQHTFELSPQEKSHLMEKIRAECTGSGVRSSQPIKRFMYETSYPINYATWCVKNGNTLYGISGRNGFHKYGITCKWMP